MGSKYVQNLVGVNCRLLFCPLVIPYKHDKTFPDIVLPVIHDRIGSAGRIHKHTGGNPVSSILLQQPLIGKLFLCPLCKGFVQCIHKITVITDGKIYCLSHTEILTVFFTPVQNKLGFHAVTGSSFFYIYSSFLQSL